MLAATDPANPYGAALKWPASAASTAIATSAAQTSETRACGATRTVGATVILVNGAIAAYLVRGDRQLLTYLPDAEPDRSRMGRAVARVLIDRARSSAPGGDAPRGMLIEEIDGTSPPLHPISPFLVEAGFVAGAMGFQATFRRDGR